jgi:hypothetical protein
MGAPRCAVKASRAVGIAPLPPSWFESAGAATIGRVRLTIEVEGSGPCPALPDDGAALIAFMSFAVSRGFGATHPLLALADRLHDEHHVRLGPLTTFYEGDPEDSEDREKLEMAWQDAAPLRESLDALATALESDEQVALFARRGNAEGLAAQARAASDEVAEAERAGRRVRLVYAL